MHVEMGQIFWIAWAALLQWAWYTPSSWNGPVYIIEGAHRRKGGEARGGVAEGLDEIQGGAEGGLAQARRGRRRVPGPRIAGRDHARLPACTSSPCPPSAPQSHLLDVYS